MFEIIILILFQRFGSPQGIPGSGRVERLDNSLPVTDREAVFETVRHLPVTRPEGQAGRHEEHHLLQDQAGGDQAMVRQHPPSGPSLALQ